MPYTILDKADLVPILPEIRALFAALGLDAAGYDDDALTGAVLAICPVVEAGWPSDDQLRRVFQHLSISRSCSTRPFSR